MIAAKKEGHSTCAKGLFKELINLNPDLSSKDYSADHECR